MKKKPLEPMPVAEVLKEFFAKSSLGDSDHGMATKLWKDWPSLANTDVLKKARPVSYQQERLVLWVENASHLQEVYFQVENIKTILNQYLKNKCVKEIYFTLNKKILKKREQAVQYFCASNV